MGLGLILRCDCTIFFCLSSMEGRKKEKKKKQVSQNNDHQGLISKKGLYDTSQIWQLIDLLNRPSNMEIGYCWYQNKNGSMWTCDMTNHAMVELDTIIALATTTSIIETNLYELHPTDMSYIQCMKECLIISSMIYKNVLLRIFQP